jgi:hypothetical protein
MATITITVLVTIPVVFFYMLSFLIYHSCDHYTASYSIF